MASNPMTTDDELLMALIRRGDQSAFRTLFERHYALLCSYAQSILHDASLSEEVVDDVFFALWKGREVLVISTSLRAYLIAAVRNGCLNELKSAAHRQAMQASSLSEPGTIAFIGHLLEDKSHPLGTLILKELESTLLHHIGQLPPECRAVFIASRLHAKSYQEIAHDLGISVNTVKYHIKNALAYLHQHMSDYLKG